MNLAVALEIPTSLMPDAPTLRLEGKAHSYADLDRATGRAVAWLSARGLGPGASVATMQAFSPAFVALTFGALAAGASIAPINARVKTAELQVLLDDMNPDILVVDERYRELAAAALEAETLAGRLVTTEELSAWYAPDEAPRWEPLEVDERAVAVKLHTSGTTGRPKSVALTHQGLTTMLLGTVPSPDGTPRGATVLSVPNHHVAGLIGMLGSVFGGRRMELLPSFSSDGWLTLVEESGADHGFLVPTMLQRIVADPAFDDTDLSRLRTVAYGAAPMPRRVIEEAMRRFPRSCQFVGSYGQTETGGTVCVLDADDHRGARDGDPAAVRRLGSIGRAIEGVEIEVLDDGGSTLGPEEQGELAVRFADAATDGWRRTGDLGYKDAGGYVYLTSRRDDLIIRAGENIDPAEIEHVLASHPAVADVAVAGLPDEEWGQVVGAFVVLRPGVDASPDDLVSHAKRSLASFKAPERVLFLTALPRSTMGKLSRRDLVAAALNAPEVDE